MNTSSNPLEGQKYDMVIWRDENTFWFITKNVDVEINREDIEQTLIDLEIGEPSIDSTMDWIDRATKFYYYQKQLVLIT